MHRLQAVMVDAENEAGFVTPTLIEHWVRYIRRIKHFDHPGDFPERLARNIGYRMQLLEFYAALLLRDYEVNTKSRGRSSTLHGSISPMLIHQFAVVVATVLEGIGSQLVRAKRQGEKVVPPADSTIPPGQWMSALASQKMQTDEQYRYSRRMLIDEIKKVMLWRKYLLMNGSEYDRELHIESLTYVNCFIPTYRTFNDLMTAMSPKWPEGSCLNDPSLLSGREKPYSLKRPLPLLPK